MIVATYPWASNLGKPHTDDSRLGLIAKIKLKTNDSDILIIPSYHSKWVTFAQESGEISSIIGDLNASNHHTDAGSFGVHEPLTTLSAGWGMSSALDAIIPNYHTC